MTELCARPLIMGSVFKSGTWLLRRLLRELTGLEPIEPEIRPGNMDPSDPAHLRFEPGCFFSWHFTPTPEIGVLLRDHDARVVFLLRNVYDLVISMYHHFRDDIDADIGRGAGQAGLFAALDQAEGLRQIIVPGETPAFAWPGIGQHLCQMQSMLRFAAEYPCLVTTFERLQHDRSGEIRRLACYLNIDIDNAAIQRLCDATSLRNMRENALRDGAGSHFRCGQSNSHAGVLNHSHHALIRACLANQAPQLAELAMSAGVSEIVTHDSADEVNSAPCV